MINNGYNYDLKHLDHNMILSFKFHCQRYQIYRDRQKSPKPSSDVNEISFPLYPDEICKQSSVNDRKIAEKIVVCCREKLIIMFQKIKKFAVSSNWL